MKNLLIILVLIQSSILSGQIFEKIEDSPIQETSEGSRSASFVDINSDGNIDIFFSSGKNGGASNELYLNNGDETFTKNTDSGLSGIMASYDGSSWSDIDNDGDLDMVVVTWYNQRNYFHLNLGDGTFEHVSDLFGDNSFSETASWADYDIDGDLDLFITNSNNTNNFFYQNNGNLEFEQIEIPGTLTSGNYRSVNWVDYDLDGDLDLYITSESTFNELYENDGNGQLTKKGGLSFLTDRRVSMGSNWIDYDNDGDLDLFVANFGESNQLFENKGQDDFELVLEFEDTDDSFGSVWGDIDNDGDLDLFIANGFSTGTTTNKLYFNELNNTFTLADEVVDDTEGWSFGAAFGDYDNDGFLDLIVANTYNESQPNDLFHNLGNTGNNWLIIACEGVISNRSAIGTVLKAKYNDGEADHEIMRTISAQHGYNSFNDLRVHFGIGSANVINELTIEWPSGVSETLENVTANQILSVKENADGFIRARFEGPSEANTGEEIEFTDRSLVDPAISNSYSWDFNGDGIEDSNETNPMYTYSEGGTFEVRLTISNSSNSGSFTQQIVVNKVLSTLYDEDTSIYPNPFNDKINIKSSHQIRSFQIRNLSGKVLKSNHSLKEKYPVIDLQDLKGGVYLIDFWIGNERKSFKILKHEEH